MSLRSILSSDQILISGFIVSIFSAIIFTIDGVAAAVLFLCGVFIGTTLTREFLRGYSSKEIFNFEEKSNAKINQAVTSSSNQTAKFLFLSIIIIIMLIGGLILFGGGIPILDSGGGDVVAGKVYDDTTPVADENVILRNGSSDDQLASTTTNENGEFEFNTTGFSEPYTVEPESEDYDPIGSVSDGKTDVVFGEAPGILSGLPIIGNGNNVDASDSGGDGEQNEGTSTDGSGDTNTSGSESDSGGQEQVFRVLNGTVVDGNGDPVSFAKVTIEYENGEKLTEEQETGQDGQYRFEDVPYEGDIQNVTLVWRASEEGYIQQDTASLDLGEFLINEEEGISRDIELTQET